jgi:hypothetical protein
MLTSFDIVCAYGTIVTGVANGSLLYRYHYQNQVRICTDSMSIALDGMTLFFV